jgi:multiple sugar transport system substrate-binding protein
MSVHFVGSRRWTTVGRWLLAPLALLTLAPLAAAQETTIDFWVMPFVDQPEVALAPFLEQFEQETGIGVNLTVVAYGESLERLQTAIAARRAPDVTYMTDGRFLPLVEFGEALAPLSGFITDAFRERYVDPEILDGYQVDGEFYVVPFGFVTYLWAINRDHVEAAGIDEELLVRMRDPESTWDWDDLESLLAALTRDSTGDGRIDTWGYAYPGASAFLHSFLLWLWNAGGDVFTPDGEISLEVDAVERAFEMLVRLKDAGYMPPGAESMGGPDAIDAFATGRTSVINNVWPANGLFVWPSQFEDLDFELVYPPVGPTGARTTYYGSALLSVLSQSTKQAEAWQLIEFFLRPELQEWLSETGFFPVTGELSPDMAVNPDVQKYYEVLPWTVSEPRHPRTAVVQRLWNAEAQSVMIGQKTPRQAAEDLRSQAIQAMRD